MDDEHEVGITIVSHKEQSLALESSRIDDECTEIVYQMGKMLWYRVVMVMWRDTDSPDSQSDINSSNSILG